ncbi:hypothetical protein GCM10023224_26890 [Streptomonospora halophila]|uniref:Uncharacterized protein n=1 Tax=Streptomonospora halophila TaxID=427369 RepID=A0ABP9GH57_9ACTN
MWSLRARPDFVARLPRALDEGDGEPSGTRPEPSGRCGPERNASAGAPESSADSAPA